jgi:hypothetical protein
MRQFGRYNLTVLQEANTSTADMVSAIESGIADWVQQKGVLVDSGPPIVIEYPDGRLAQFQVGRMGTGAHWLRSYSLTEPIDRGIFRTTIEVANDDSRISLDARLEAGTEGLLAPLSVDARCPSFLRQLMRHPWRWTIGAWTLPIGNLEFRGEAGGQALLELLADPMRSLPVVVVSEDEQGWTDDFIEALRADVSGVGVVVSVDASASWEVTNRIGRHWSCYNGAIRIYWPRWRVEQDPLDHPLWTRRRIYELRDTEELAQRSVRNTIRRRLLALSVSGLKRDPLFEHVLQVHREDSRSRAKDNVELLDIYARENDQLRERITQLEEEKAQLSLEFENYRTVQEWKQSAETSDIEPDTDSQPETAEEALLLARERYAAYLTFGDSLEGGVADLAPEAGPPPKILHYLATLSSLSEALRAGPLGRDIVEWLSERGIAASGESETVRKNGGRRFTIDGRSERFELHLKPNDATSPDRCVRIYFRWDPKRQSIVVGWLGRHPD